MENVYLCETHAGYILQIYDRKRYPSRLSFVCALEIRTCLAGVSVGCGPWLRRFFFYYLAENSHNLHSKHERFKLLLYFPHERDFYLKMIKKTAIIRAYFNENLIFSYYVLYRGVFEFGSCEQYSSFERY